MKFLNSTKLAVAGLSAIAVLGLPGLANAASIWRGSDYLRTPGGGGTGFNFGGSIGEVFFKGVPVGPGNTDTVIQRKADCALPSIGSSCTVPIEMTELSLVSEAPVNVGGSFFDVFVSLDPNNASTGSMTINHESADNGTPAVEGTFSSILNISFKANFVPVGGGPVAQSVTQSVQLILDQAFWSHEPPPGTVIVEGDPGTILGDNTADQDANSHGGINPDQLGNEVGDFFIVGLAPHSKPNIAGHEVESASVPEPSSVLAILAVFGGIFGLKNKRS